MVWATAKGILITLVGGAILSGLFLLGFLIFMQRGPQEAVVPDLIGQPLDKAREIARARGLSIDVRAHAHSQTVPEGCVTDMRPYRNKRVKQGRSIEVTVSNGPKDVRVPDVKGLDLQNARETVTEAKLRVGQVMRRKSAKVQDEVLDQSPGAGENVPRDSQITLTVSGGADYGELDVADDKATIFRKVEVTVPRGDALQTVKVEKLEGDRRSTEYSRVHRPGEKVVVDIRAREGARVTVYVGESIAYEGTL